jgi:hypothetical protein
LKSGRKAFHAATTASSALLEPASTIASPMSGSGPTRIEIVPFDWMLHPAGTVNVAPDAVARFALSFNRSGGGSGAALAAGAGVVAAGGELPAVALAGATGGTGDPQARTNAKETANGTADGEWTARRRERMRVP